MQLNDNTFTVLKNFASIQSNIVIPSGNKIRTISEAKNVMAVAELDQSFDQTFGVYNLDEFLSVMNLVGEPNLDFSDESVTISDQTGRSKVKYFFSSPEILTTVTKDIPMPSCEVSFTLDEATLNKIQRAASVLGHEKMVIEPSDGCIRLTVVDSSDATSNSFSIDVPGQYESEQFSFVINIANLKLIGGNYSVEVSSKLLSHFTNQEKNVEYFIALEKSSTYNS